MRRLVLLLYVLAFLSPLPALADQASGETGQTFEQIIEGQLQAFRSNNAEQAYSFASPGIQAIFPSPGVFMDMVQRSYRGVFEANSVRFGEVSTDKLGRPTQRATITSRSGERFEALYSMEQQPDGSWKIDGCVIVKLEGGEA